MIIFSIILWIAIIWFWVWVIGHIFSSKPGMGYRGSNHYTTEVDGKKVRKLTRS